MQTNRRGLLRAFAAAPAAAVAVKSSLTEQVSKLGAMNGADMISRGVPGGIPSRYSSDADTGWLKARLAEYVQDLANLETEAPENQVADLVAVTTQIDALRSVSANAKISMANRELAARAKARRKNYIETQIDRLKKQLGPLAGLI